ncbi:Rid family detoxifying hydrolase [uncultured Arcticibacterium sp.]|uniref:RidA family protein n=1 Tax=uncultured Arcticibacterium sp. TaxID=2173042 RepID=UPI0030F996DE
MKKWLVVIGLIVSMWSCERPEKEGVTYLQTEEFAKLNRPYSQAVAYEDILYVSGQIGALPNGQMVEGGIEAETMQTMENLKAILEANGTSMNKVIKCTCMLADMAEFGAMSAAYVKYFPENKPARSALQGALPLGAKVEIECMAALD